MKIIYRGWVSGDLITTPYGETFMVCLGFRIQSDWMPFHHLGREVFLVPVTWDNDGWFTAGVNGTVESVMDMPLNSHGTGNKRTL